MLNVHWRLAKVTIEHLDACACIERYDRPETLFYVDPPYYHLTQGYAAKFSDADFTRLRDCLAKIKGRFLLSLNDDPTIRQLFRAFRLEGVSLTYSSGNARSGRSTRSKIRRELLIRNYR